MAGHCSRSYRVVQFKTVTAANSGWGRLIVVDGHDTMGVCVCVCERERERKKGMTSRQDLRKPAAVVRTATAHVPQTPEESWTACRPRFYPPGVSSLLPIQYWHNAVIVAETTLSSTAANARECRHQRLHYFVYRTSSSYESNIFHFYEDDATSNVGLIAICPHSQLAEPIGTCSTPKLVNVKVVQELSASSKESKTKIEWAIEQNLTKTGTLSAA